MRYLGALLVIVLLGLGGSIPVRKNFVRFVIDHIGPEHLVENYADWTLIGAIGFDIYGDEFDRLFDQVSNGSEIQIEITIVILYGLLKDIKEHSADLHTLVSNATDDIRNVMNREYFEKFISKQITYY